MIDAEKLSDLELEELGKTYEGIRSQRPGVDDSRDVLAPLNLVTG